MYSPFFIKMETEQKNFKRPTQYHTPYLQAEAFRTSDTQ